MKSHKSQVSGTRWTLVLLGYASLEASRTLLQKLLACLTFTLDSEDLFYWYTWQSDFYGLWQQHKQLKTMEMKEAWPDTYTHWVLWCTMHKELIFLLHQTLLGVPVKISEIRWIIFQKGLTYVWIIIKWHWKKSPFKFDSNGFEKNHHNSTLTSKIFSHKTTKSHLHTTPLICHCI